MRGLTSETLQRLEQQLPLMLAVPAGTLQMGTPEQELSRLAKHYGGTRESYREESPQHAVAVAGFGLAETVINRALPALWRGEPAAAEMDEDAQLPAVGLTWHDAIALCAWLNALQPAVVLRAGDGSTQRRRGIIFRLPTEAEWEYAARGSDGRQFPWGDTFDPACANTRESARWAVSRPGRFPAGRSPFGQSEMAGTVWEWTASLDRAYPYRADDGRNDLQAAGRRILRGGCYANPVGYARCACRFRLLPGVQNEFLGVRLACDLPV